MHAYLDDCLLLDQNKENLLANAQIVLDLANQLGFCINAKKSDFLLSRTFLFLQMQIDARTWIVRPSEERINRLLSTLLTQTTPRRKIASLLGQINSLTNLVLLGNVYKRSLQRWLLNLDPVAMNYLDPVAMTCFSGILANSAFLETQKLAACGGSNSSSHSFNLPLSRCLENGMGCPHERSVCLRPVESSGEAITYQLSRAFGSMQIITDFSSQICTHSSEIGQFNSS